LRDRPDSGRDVGQDEHDSSHLLGIQDGLVHAVIVMQRSGDRKMSSMDT
jgi:hypothetical protein